MAPAAEFTWQAPHLMFKQPKKPQKQLWRHWTAENINQIGEWSP
jgi:hypothetical protein